MKNVVIEVFESRESAEALSALKNKRARVWRYFVGRQGIFYTVERKRKVVKT